MVIVERNKESLFKQHEVLFLAILIFVILILLFSFVKIPEKSIVQLQKEDSGKFKITGFVSNINANNKSFIQFTVSDNTGNIITTIFEKINLNKGDLIEGTCELNIWNSIKKCNLTDFEIINQKEKK